MQVGLAGDVPGAVERLLSARSQIEAEAAISSINQGAVVQGAEFEAIEPLIPVLLVILSKDVQREIKYWIMDTLIEVAYGAPHPSEIANGNAQLHDHCLAELSKGIVAFYNLLDAEDERLRKDAIDGIDAVEPDRDRVRLVPTALLGNDRSELVRNSAQQVLDDL